MDGNARSCPTPVARATRSGHGAGIVVEIFESCNPHFRHNWISLGKVTHSNLLPMQLPGLAIRLIPKDTAIRRVIARSMHQSHHHSDRLSQVPLQ